MNGEPIQTIRDQCPEDKRFVVEDALIPIEPGCKWIKTTSVEGQGKFGTVYRLCKQCDGQEPVCAYVVKHIKRNSSEETFRNDFQKEVQMHIFLRDSGIAPNVYDAFICGDEGYIVLDRKDYNIKEYAFKLLEALKKSSLVFDILNQLQTSVIRLVGQLHSYSYIHDDPHLENFMIEVRDGNLVNWRNPQIIDFGKAIKVESPLVANQREPQKGIEMSFDMLKREVLDKEKLMQLTDPDAIARQKILAKGIPDAPRKGKVAPMRASNPTPFKKPLDLPDDSPSSPLKKSKQMFDDFDSPVKSKPFASNLFDSPEFTPVKNKGLFDNLDTPQTPVNKNLFGSFDDDSPSTPVRGNSSMFDTPKKSNSFQTPEKEDEWMPSSKLSYDSDDEDDSFLSRRYYPYRIGGEDRSVDMIDPEYYEDEDGYGKDDEYLTEWSGID
jgi:hypothetical protein